MIKEQAVLAMLAAMMVFFGVVAINVIIAILGMLVHISSVPFRRSSSGRCSYS